MNIKFHRTNTKPFDLTTVGFWRFDQPNNKGTLHVYVAKMCDWRYEVSVFGHELIESVYCWLCGVTTEVCDKFDDQCELEFDAGTRDVHLEPGFDPKCPYRWGHVMGSWWEWVFIHATLASWKKYDVECNRVMGID